jgi:hypothetical protein
MRTLLIVFSILLADSVQAGVIQEPMSSTELMALLDSPDAGQRLAGTYFVYGVMEGHVVTTKQLEVCILDEPVTMDDFVTAVRTYYAASPYLWAGKYATKLASVDIILAVQKRYPCKPEH